MYIINLILKLDNIFKVIHIFDILFDLNFIFVCDRFIFDFRHNFKYNN